ncbi:MAG: dTDP-4-dehydrorhamnose reductase [Bacteroidales bacterium]|nr:dTDP-4-dehydrorhamnose reductase [Bacteroidales bacterium]
MKKVLVTGSNGQLGSEIRKLENEFPEFRFIFTDIEELDLLDFAAVEEFVAAENISICLNCAAYTSVDKAEDEQGLAMQVNFRAVENLAKVCGQNKALLVHISTDYVFDGKMYRPYTEPDPTAPASVYGWSKLKGEQAVFENTSRAIIVRTSWLCSAFGNNFVKAMLRLGEEKNELGVVFDQIGTPTFAADLAKAMLRMVQNVSSETILEIYHYSNEGAISWYDFAKAIMEEAGLNCQVKPILTKDFPTKATRPFYSVLSKEKIKIDFKLSIPYWRDSLKTVIDELLTQ